MDTPPSYYRQPPDGHEFPDYEETTTTAASKVELPLISSLRCWDVGGFPKNYENAHGFNDDVAFTATRGTPIKPANAEEHEYKRVDDVVKNATVSKAAKSIDSFRSFENSDLLEHTLFNKNKNTPNSSGHLDLTISNKELFSPVKTEISRRSLEPTLTSHNRSQSCGDISENCEKRGSTDKWRMLVEQRKRGLSKLKGLVIPENANESDVTANAVVDIPEIKTSNTINITGIADIMAVPLEQHVSHSRNSSLDCPKTSLLSNTCNIPKYSPAFKRKGLQIYGGTSIYSSNSIERDLKKTKELVDTTKTQNNFITQQECALKTLKSDSDGFRISTSTHIVTG